MRYHHLFVFSGCAWVLIAAPALAQPIEVTLEQASHRLHVSVRDFGGGICEELQEALFSPFARGGSDQEGRFGGMGLGLYICRSIVELHGGTIGVLSKEGAGSTFSFELPVGQNE